MKEQLISKVLMCMQDTLSNQQMMKLKSVMNSIMVNYVVEPEKQELFVMDDTWEVILQEYLATKVLEGKSSGTVNRYKYELNRLLTFVNKSIADIKSNDITKYMISYKAIKHVSNSTLKNIRAVFSSFFGWAYNRGYISRNIVTMVEQIKVERKIRKPYTDEEREKMFRACKTRRDRALLECFYSTALRVSELASLNIDDIRFKTKDLIVFGKGAKERVVYLNERSHMYLKEYLESRTDNNPALFVSEKFPYQRLSKTGIESIIRKLGKSLNIHAYPHKFRRTSLTNALNRGMPLQEVMILAGHSKPETTMMYCTISQDSVQFHHKKYLSA